MKDKISFPTSFSSRNSPTVSVLILVGSLVYALFIFLLHPVNMQAFLLYSFPRVTFPFTWVSDTLTDSFWPTLIAMHNRPYSEPRRVFFITILNTSCTFLTQRVALKGHLKQAKILFMLTHRPLMKLGWSGIADTGTSIRKYKNQSHIKASIICICTIMKAEVKYSKLSTNNAVN